MVITHSSKTIETEVQKMIETYPEFYFLGIHLIYDSFDHRDCVIEIENWNFLNTGAFISTSILFVQECPSTSPYLYE